MEIKQTPEQKQKVIELTAALDDLFDREHLNLLQVIDICDNLIAIALNSLTKEMPKERVKKFSLNVTQAIQMVINDHIDGTNIKPMGEA